MSYVYATKPAHDAYVTSYSLNQVTETATGGGGGGGGGGSM